VEHIQFLEVIQSRSPEHLPLASGRHEALTRGTSLSLWWSNLAGEPRLSEIQYPDDDEELELDYALAKKRHARTILREINAPIPIDAS